MAVGFAKAYIKVSALNFVLNLRMLELRQMHKIMMLLKHNVTFAHVIASDNESTVANAA